MEEVIREMAKIKKINNVSEDLEKDKESGGTEIYL